MDPTGLALLLSLPVLLVFSAFASASETALFGVTPGELARLRRTSPGVLRIIERLRAHPRRLLGQVLLLNMVANVAYFVATSVLTVRAETTTERVLISVGSVLAIVLLGEVFAKLFATSARVFFLRFAAPFHAGVGAVISPFLAGFDRFVIAPLARLVAPGSGDPQPVTPDELGALIELSAAEGAFRGTEQGLLRSIVSLGGMRVREVMRPRVDLVAIERGASKEVVLRTVLDTGHDHYPVCVGGLDGRVVSMLHANRMLAGWSMERSVEPVRFVPELARLDTLLSRFRDEGVSVAVCVDEHGGVSGLITVADVVEVLVSGAETSEQGSDLGIERVGERAWVVPGRLTVRHMIEAFGERAAIAKAGRATTIAGLLMAQLGTMPVEGDSVELGDLRLTAIQVEDRAILRVGVALRERRS
ncbi:MAG: DUF21 domain-containing protein [Planctomycetota bacterium]|nr:MAG: DUF21 domain-containing protein [Planctomycetota bacterium]